MKNDLSHLPNCIALQWFTLTDKSIQYIFNYINANSTYLKSFKNLYVVMKFFQTIIFNNKDLRAKVYGLDLNLLDCEMGGRYIDWITGPDFPKILDEHDLNRVYQSQLLFSRKFKENISLSSLEKNMENIQKNRPLCESIVLSSF
ncbi:hypothetical protein J4731_01310 [Providencia rettgeri]|nr:hypothetical protein [Providencia rettgeri]